MQCWEKRLAVLVPLSVGLEDIIKMAIVVVLGRAKEPSVKTMRCPGCAFIRIFIDDCFCAGRSHWGVPFSWRPI
jgi:hypothetical protein